MSGPTGDDKRRAAGMVTRRGVLGHRGPVTLLTTIALRQREEFALHMRAARNDG